MKPVGTSWANPAHRFQTSGTSVALNGVPPGSYDFRVGAFSEAAGRWEWQELMSVFSSVNSGHYSNKSTFTEWAFFVLKLF